MPNASQVIYTGATLTYIPVSPNTTLDTILGLINTAFNTSSSAPNYTGYNLACVKQTDGTSHPTNTQNFAEGISKILCDLKTAYTLFTGTTYTGDISTINTAIGGIQIPNITYTPFSIAPGDTITQQWNKTYTGIEGIRTSIIPTSANWATIGITAPTTPLAAYNSLIAYLSSLTTTVAGKEPLIGSFNNSVNCLSGTTSDTLRTTVGLITNKLCPKPDFDVSTITWGSVTPEANLQSTVQSIISQADYLSTNAVVNAGTGLNVASVGSIYQGKKLQIDPSYTQLYKVMVTGDAYTDALTLDHKIGSSDSSITMNVVGNKVDMTVTHPVTSQVKVNVSDATAGYLSAKIVAGANSTWGMSNIPIVSLDNGTISIVPNIDSGVAASNLMTYISNTPEAFAQFTSLVNQVAAVGTCVAPTSLVVTNGDPNFSMTWTASGSASSQLTKYRQIGAVNWISSVNFNPGNPRAADATTSSAVNLSYNTPYEFAVDSVCADGGIGTSNVYQMIIYNCQSTTHTIVGGVISVTQNPLPGIDTIQYRLKNAGNTVVDSKTATGLAPQVTFASQASGTYHAEWRYGSTVNGVTLYSDASSQINAWCSVSSLVIP